MKKILLFILTLISLSSIGQPIVGRAGSSFTVMDSRWMAQYNLFLPRYADTTAANVQKGIDSLGAKIFTYDVFGEWLRVKDANGVKKWIQTSSSSGGVNIYNSNGTLTGNRTLSGANTYSLGFDGVTSFRAEANNGAGNTGLIKVDSDSISLNGRTAIHLRVNSSEKLIATSTGTGIGTTSPSTLFHVNGSGAFRLSGSGEAAGRLLVADANGVGTWTDPAASNLWSITGNSGTVAGTNFLGTTDNVNVVFKRNSVQSGLLASSTGNTSFGVSALNASSTGTQNSAFGYSALAGNTTASNNIAIGSSALLSTTTGGSNVAAGVSALESNTTGVGNVAVGFNALYLTDGTPSYNTAIGYQSMQGGFSSTGGLNTTVGKFSLQVNTTGTQNTAVGVNALWKNTTGFKNTAIGAGALENNPTGQENTAVGQDAGLNNTTGIYNNYFGVNAKGGSNAIGNNIMGYYSGASLAAGNQYNVGIGHNALYHASQKVDVTKSTAIGYNAYTTANNQLSISDSTTRFTFTGVSRGTANYVLTDSLGTGQFWVARPVGAATSVPLSGITAATGTNDISNGGFMQTWRWPTLGTNGGLYLLSDNTTAISNLQKLLIVSLLGANANAGQTTNGAIISNQHSGTSSTNVGLELWAKNATNNYALIIPPLSGDVGIGTSTPTSLLHVVAVPTTGIGTAFSSSTITSGKLMDLTITGTAGTNGKTGINVDMSGTHAASGVSSFGVATTNNSAGTTSTNYGLYTTVSSASTSNIGVFSSASSSTGSTNIGGQFLATASGGGAAYAILVPASSGDVGIGVNPTSKLHVVPVQTTGIGVAVASSTTTTGSIMDITGTSTALAAGNEGLNIGISGANGTVGITATGARISVTNTNATSGTNTGLDLTASGATTANNALNIAAGAIALNGSAGTSGQVLTSAGANTLPTWSTPSSGGWALTGNAIASGNSEFFGSTNNRTVIVKTNNTKIAAWDSTGSLEIGSYGHQSILGSNDAKLIIQGTIGQYEGGVLKFYLGQISASTKMVLRDASATDAVVFNTSGDSYFNGGKVGIGVTSPTARLELVAGSATANTAPIELNSGPVETVARAGIIEYTTPQLFFTNGAAVRQELFQGQQGRVSTQFDATTTTLANVTNLTANVAAGKTYRFEAILHTTTDAVGGHKYAIAGTATATNVIYQINSINNGTNAFRLNSRQTALAGSAGEAVGTAYYTTIAGTITVNAAGTLTVQFAQNAASGTSSVLVGSTFYIIEIL